MNDTKEAPHFRNGYVFSHSLAVRLQRECPELASDFAQGATQASLVRDYGLLERYGVESSEIMRKAVAMAIGGDDGYFGCEPLEGLLSEQDYGAALLLARRNHLDSVRGALTAEQRSSNASIGGKAAGEYARAHSIGVCGLSIEERTDAGRLSARARGFTPFEDEELETLWKMGNNPDYLMRGKAYDTGRIADELNSLYHGGSHVRSKRSISDKLRALRKKRATSSA